MSIENSHFSYEEFIAFILLYAAGMNQDFSTEELNFIRAKTNIADINRIKAKLDGMSDAESIEMIDRYKKIYLTTPESEGKARRDLEALLRTPGLHSQLEKAAVHIIEKLI